MSAWIFVSVDTSRWGHLNRDVGIAEVADDVAQELGLRKEVRVEDRDEGALGDLEAGVERARLVAHAIDSVQIHGVDAAGSQPLDVRADERLRLVGRVVEHLDLELVPRVVDGGDGLEQAGRDGRLVEERQLHGHARQLVVAHGLARQKRGRCDVTTVAPAQNHQVKPV